MIKLPVEKKKSENRGTTLIEMIVCFALMAIFVSSAAAIIASVTNLYYQAKGETYGRQVSDIIVQRVVSELEGAKWKDGSNENPKISTDKKTIELFNRSDTKTTVSTADKQLLIKYAAFSNDEMTKGETTWKFNKNVYFNYEIEELLFIPGSALGSGTAAELAAKLQSYRVDVENIEYDADIVLVLLTVKSDKYGTYRTVRPVKMYNVPTDYAWPVN
ncbi:MAG: hypothetical protein IKP92_08235 [Lachnospiraceae bacterium]|nr:hypothetical protein [Lachnospiraceae bacterium]